MLNFPANPSPGAQYTLNGRTWQYNGKGWARVSAGAQVATSFYLLSPLVATVVESLPVLVTNDFGLVDYV